MPQLAKPDRVKRIHGTYKPHRAKPDISGEAVLPDCPEWLSDVARRHWDSNLAHMVSIKVALHPADQMALATYANLCAKQETDSDNFNAPLIAQMRAIWLQFGLTPTARENLGLDTKPKKPNVFA